MIASRFPIYFFVNVKIDVFSYKIIVHKTQYEIDLETEPVSDPITFDINRLISDEELPDLVL